MAPGGFAENILTLMLPCLGVQASGSLIAQELAETNTWGSETNMILTSASCGYYKMWNYCAGGCCQPVVVCRKQRVN